MHCQWILFQGNLVDCLSFLFANKIGIYLRGIAMGQYFWDVLALYCMIDNQIFRNLRVTHPRRSYSIFHPLMPRFSDEKFTPMR